MRAAPDPRILTGWSGASPHVLRFPLRAFLRFPVCPPGCSPSSAVLWFPFVRRSPVRSLRPLPGSGSPSVSLRVPFPLSNLHLSAAARRFRRRWSRAAGTNVTSSAATTPLGSRDPPALRMGSGWARWDAATESPVMSGRERSTSPHPNRPYRRTLMRTCGLSVVGAECDLRCVLTGQVLSAGRRALPVLLCHLPGLPRAVRRAVRPGHGRRCRAYPAAEAGPLLALLSAQFPVTLTALAPRFRYSDLRNVHGLEACLASRWRGIVLSGERRRVRLAWPAGAG